MSEEIYNLFISDDENAWESSSTIFDIDRCIVEYTEKDLVDKFVKLGKNEISEIKNSLCIFAYEDYCDKGYDFNVMNELDEEDYIRQGSHRSKSVAITEEGMKLSQELLEKYKIVDWK